MNGTSRLAAVLVYILPVVGWVLVILLYRNSQLAVFHLKQAIGLVLFLIGTLVTWIVVGWLLAWIPYMATLSIALFTLVIAIYFYGVVIWIQGISRALNNRLDPLPLFGRWASRLPIA